MDEKLGNRFQFFFPLFLFTIFFAETDSNVGCKYSQRSYRRAWHRSQFKDNNPKLLVIATSNFTTRWCCMFKGLIAYGGWLSCTREGGESKFSKKCKLEEYETAHYKLRELKWQGTNMWCLLVKHISKSYGSNRKKTSRWLFSTIQLIVVWFPVKLLQL